MALQIKEHDLEEVEVGQPILEARNIKVYFSPKGKGVKSATHNYSGWVKANDDITLNILKGETLSVVGESGCGKSTFGRAITRLQDITGGEITYRGLDLTKISRSRMNDLRANIQFIFQDPYSSLTPTMTVSSLIGEAMLIHGKRKLAKLKRQLKDVNFYEKNEEIIQKLKEVNLPNISEKYELEIVKYKLKKLKEQHDYKIKYLATDLKKDLKELDSESKSDVKNIQLDYKKLEQEGKTGLETERDNKIVEAKARVEENILTKQDEYQKDVAAENEEYNTAIEPLTKRFEKLKQHLAASKGNKSEKEKEIVDNVSSKYKEIYETEISGLIEKYDITTKKNLVENILKVMKKCGLSEYMIHRYPHEFSGGQRQRVAIARALALNPEFIVCDESVSALDVSIQSQIINLLKDIQKEEGYTYLFITHDLSVVKHISDRIAVFYLGKMVEIGMNDDIFKGKTHPYTKALLESIPKPKITKEPLRTIEGEIPSNSNPPKGCNFVTRCKFVTDVCKAEEPELQEVGPNHFVACHNYKKLKG